MRPTHPWLLATAAALALCACGGEDDGVGPVRDTTPPAAPRNLRVQRIGDGEVWLAWTAVAEDRVTYRVYRSASGSTPVRIDTTSQAAFGDKGLDYATEYTYEVTAVDAVGNEGPPSNPAGGQPLNSLAPLPPQSLRAVAHNLTLLSLLEVVLDWDSSPESDLAVYRVYRSRTPGAPLATANLRAVVARPRFVDDQVAVGETFYYRVTAVDRGEKESLASDEASDVPLAAPELAYPIQGEATTPTPSFRWRAVPGARSYQVVVTTSPTTGEISAMPSTTDTAANFIGRSLADGTTETLRPGVVYYWRVIASTRADHTENSVSAFESFKVR